MSKPLTTLEGIMAMSIKKQDGVEVITESMVKELTRLMTDQPALHRALSGLSNIQLKEVGRRLGYAFRSNAPGREIRAQLEHSIRMPEIWRQIERRPALNNVEVVR